MTTWVTSLAHSSESVGACWQQFQLINMHTYIFHCGWLDASAIGNSFKVDLGWKGQWGEHSVQPFMGPTHGEPGGSSAAIHSRCMLGRTTDHCKLQGEQGIGKLSCAAVERRPCLEISLLGSPAWWSWTSSLQLDAVGAHTQISLLVFFLLDLLNIYFFIC